MSVSLLNRIGPAEHNYTYSFSLTDSLTVKLLVEDDLAEPSSHQGEAEYDVVEGGVHHTGGQVLHDHLRVGGTSLGRERGAIGWEEISRGFCQLRAGVENERHRLVGSHHDSEQVGEYFYEAHHEGKYSDLKFEIFEID